MVLHDTYQNLIPGLQPGQSVAVGHQVQALRGVSGKNDLVGGRCVNKAPHFVSGFLQTFCGLHAQGVEAAHGICIAVLIKIPLRLEYTGGLLSRGRTV